MDFAAKLFDAPFEWRDGDPARQDLVGAQRVDIPADHSGGRWPPRSTCGWPPRMATGRRTAADRGFLARCRRAPPRCPARQRLAMLRSLLAGAAAVHRPGRAVFPAAPRRSPRPRLAALVDARRADPRQHRHAGAVRPLPPVRPGHRGRVHLPDAGRPARVAGPARDLPGLPRGGLRVRLLQAVRRGVPGRDHRPGRRRRALHLARGPRRPAELAAARRGRGRPPTRTTRRWRRRTPPRRRTACCAGAAAHCTRGALSGGASAPGAVPRRAAARRRTCGRCGGWPARSGAPRGCLACGARGTGHDPAVRERQRGVRGGAGHRALPGAARGRRTSPAGPAAAASCSRSATAGRPPRSSRPTWSPATPWCSSDG